MKRSLKMADMLNKGQERGDLLTQLLNLIQRKQKREYMK